MVPIVSGVRSSSALQNASSDDERKVALFDHKSAKASSLSSSRIRAILSNPYDIPAAPLWKDAVGALSRDVNKGPVVDNL